jgi:NCS1 family nucleobase:cation symporter-1
MAGDGAHARVLWASFLGFWLLNMFVVWCGVESIRFLQSFSAPFMLVMSLTLLFWMLHKAGGFGPMLSAPSHFHSTSSFLHFFFPSLTAMVGYWATLSLNIPDFTRYAKSQDSQIVGQAFGLPVAMTLYSFIGIACTSASETIFWRADMVAHHPAGTLPSAAGGGAGAGRRAGGDAQREHRRQCGLAFE